MSFDNPRSAHKKCAVVKQPTNIGDLPQELQVRVLGSWYGRMSWKEKIAMTANARLICKWTAAGGWVPLIKVTFCRELERRMELCKTLAEYSCLAPIATTMAAKDSTIHQIFTAMYGPDLGQISKVTMFKGFKMWGKINDKEEKWLIKCRDHLAAGNENLEGIEPDPDPEMD